MVKLMTFVYKQRLRFYIAALFLLITSIGISVVDISIRTDPQKATTLSNIGIVLWYAALGIFVIVIMCENFARSAPVQFFVVTELKMPTDALPEFIEFTDLYEEMKSAEVTSLGGGFSRVKITIWDKKKWQKVQDFLSNKRRDDLQRINMN